MSEWNVRVERIVVQHQTVYGQEADTPEEAKRLAIQLARDLGSHDFWELSRVVVPIHAPKVVAWPDDPDESEPAGG